MESMKWLSWQRLRLSSPMNQSGDGTILVNKDTWESHLLMKLIMKLISTLVLFPSRNIVVEVLPAPPVIGGAMKASRKLLVAASLSSWLLSPVSTNCLTPSPATDPTLNRRNPLLWENPSTQKKKKLVRILPPPSPTYSLRPLCRWSPLWILLGKLFLLPECSDTQPVNCQEIRATARADGGGQKGHGEQRQEPGRHAFTHFWPFCHLRLYTEYH